ncbi:hypothetical protein EDB86DRAFT_2829960 [Lactarius hatsudake]|nr:hypothetical protein EDB86DRAFT_2829960 [Lactarius hatsudake]
MLALTDLTIPLLSKLWECWLGMYMPSIILAWQQTPWKSHELTIMTHFHGYVSTAPTIAARVRQQGSLCCVRPALITVTSLVLFDPGPALQHSQMTARVRRLLGCKHPLLQCVKQCRQYSEPWEPKTIASTLFPNLDEQILLLPLDPQSCQCRASQPVPRRGHYPYLQSSASFLTPSRSHSNAVKSLTLHSQPPSLHFKSIKLPILKWPIKKLKTPPKTLICHRHFACPGIICHAQRKCQWIRVEWSAKLLVLAMGNIERLAR